MTASRPTTNHAIAPQEGLPLLTVTQWDAMRATYPHRVWMLSNPLSHTDWVKNSEMNVRSLSNAITALIKKELVIPTKANKGFKLTPKGVTVAEAIQKVDPFRGVALITEEIKMTTKPVKAAVKTATKAKAVAKKGEAVRVRTSHEACDHASTKVARAACRRAKAAVANKA